MEFYFPKTYRIIDFKRPIEFLDKEFQKLNLTGEVGNKRVDKLVKVFLKDGSEKWLLVHVEIQASIESSFAERLYTYNYLIFNRYHKDVITLAILTDDNKKFRPEKYEVKYPDTCLMLKFGINTSALIRGGLFLKAYRIFDYHLVIGIAIEND
jgi:hypothetical protein